MELDMPLWTILPGVVLLTSIFFLAPHMNYNSYNWIVGNSLVAFGVGICYIGKSIFGNFKW